MIVRLLPTQIPAFWGAIKYAIVQTDEIEEKDQQRCLNKLLHSLLNDKSQCFVRLDDERKLLTVVVTKIVIDRITSEKSLQIQSLYSWAVINNKEWQNDFLLVKEFAKHEECQHITFDSPNPRIWQVGKQLGFREKLRTFIFNVGVGHG